MGNKLAYCKLFRSNNAFGWVWTTPLYIVFSANGPGSDSIFFRNSSTPNSTSQKGQSEHKMSTTAPPIFARDAHSECTVLMEHACIRSPTDRCLRYDITCFPTSLIFTRALKKNVLPFPSILSSPFMLQVENACGLLIAAVERLALPLRERCLGFIGRNAGLVSRTPGYGSLPLALKDELAEDAAVRAEVAAIAAAARARATAAS